MSEINYPVREWPKGGAVCGMSMLRILDANNSEVCQIRRKPTESDAEFERRAQVLVDAINGVGRLVDTHA